MTVFAYDLTHKHQTKANDCWYASIQMLKTWKAGGVKTKAAGQATAYLHRGILGHRLLADSARSKRFVHVLAENDLMTIPRTEISLTTMELPTGFRGASALTALQKYGPIIIGGGYGELGPIKNLGHFIVLAGVDTDRQRYKIYDPDKRAPDWRTLNAVASKWWDDDESAIVVKDK